MALRQMWSFDYLPAGLDLTTDINALSNKTCLDPAVIPQIPPLAGMFITADGWLSMANYQFGSTTYTNAFPGFGIALASLFPVGTGWMYIGFRTRIPTGNAAPQGQYASYPFFTTGSVQGSYLGAYLQEGQMPGSTGVVGGEHYFEFAFNNTTKKYSVWIDGVQTVNQAAISVTATNYIWFGGSGAAGASVTAGTKSARDFRDFVFLEDTGDGSMYSNRLGPQRARLMSLAAATAADSVLAAGSSGVSTPLAALNFAYPNPPVATPSLTNNTINDTVQGSFALPTITGANPVAVQLLAGFQASQSGEVLTPTVSQGGQALMLPGIAVPDVNQKLGKQLALMPLAPDGGAWNFSKIAAAQFSVAASSALAARAKTAVLMHFDPNLSASTAITDDMGHAVVNTSNKFTLSASNGLYGNGGLVCGTGATTGGLAIADTGTDVELTGDFTVEVWSYLLSYKITCLFSAGSAAASNGVQINTTATGVISVVANGTTLFSTAASILSTGGQWNHIALVRFGATWTLYVDGTRVGTATGPTASFTGGLNIGSNKFTANTSWAGNLDDFRLSNVARYLANFTRPTAAFSLNEPAVAITSAFSTTVLGSPLPAAAATTVYAILASINAKFGLALQQLDVANTAIASGATSVTLTALGTSYGYLPGTTVTLTAT